MIFLASIIALWLICWWFIMIDWPAVVAPVKATNALSRKKLVFGLLIVFVVALLVPATHNLAASSTSNLSFVTPPAGILIGVSVFITLLITYQVSRLTSVCYAFFGALLALQIYLKGTIDWDANLRIVLSWVTAPVLSLVLTFLIYKLYNYILSKSKAHLLRQTFYQRIIVVLGAILLAIGIGINNGAVLVSLTDLIIPEDGSIEALIVPIVALIALVLIFHPKLRSATTRLAAKEFNISSQATTSIIIAAGITLLLYSFDIICTPAGLRATPLSVISLLLGGLVGLAIANKKETIENKTLIRSTLAVAITPVIAVVVSYCLFFIFDIQNPKINHLAESLNSKRVELDIYLMIIAVVAILITILVIIIIQQQKAHKALERISNSRQQQLNENLKSLNELEVRGVLIESQGLDNTLEIKREELINTAYSLSDQKEFLESVFEKVNILKKTDNPKVKDKNIDELQQDLLQRMTFAKEIEHFYAQAEVLHKDFMVRINEAFSNLTPQERKLTTLLRLGFSSRHIAVMMNISPKSVEIGRYRLRSKFGLKREDNLIKFIQSL